MSDSLYGGKRFRTFNVSDDFNREVLIIEIYTSLPAEYLIKAFECLKKGKGATCSPKS